MFYWLPCGKYLLRSHRGWCWCCTNPRGNVCGAVRCMVHIMRCCGCCLMNCLVMVLLHSVTMWRNRGSPGLLAVFNRFCLLWGFTWYLCLVIINVYGLSSVFIGDMLLRPPEKYKICECCPLPGVLGTRNSLQLILNHSYHRVILYFISRHSEPERYLHVWATATYREMCSWPAVCCVFCTCQWHLAAPPTLAYITKAFDHCFWLVLILLFPGQCVKVQHCKY